ncbi:MAG: toll/interleukin-1 receptor domain-containing protein [Oscillospiraceae bacterium]|nr:toll/interleukin-1 receptor domain-containing protein [Oscillospiraceae bacterium]
MTYNKLTVFLSHSHKDIEKVRKIRDILETLDCEPIIFFLKCLDDDNPDLEDFIKKEIAARNVFLYCKSKNAEKSIWVQKELEFIKSIDKSRLFTVDLEQGFSINLVEVLQSILHLIIKNTVVICCSKQDVNSCEMISQELQKNGFISQFYFPQTDGIPAMKRLENWEYTKLHDQYCFYFDTVIVPQMEQLIKKGVLLIIESSNLFDGDWSSFMAGKIINWCEMNHNKVIYATLKEDIIDIIHAVNRIAVQ